MCVHCHVLTWSEVWKYDGGLVMHAPPANATVSGTWIQILRAGVWIHDPQGPPQMPAANTSPLTLHACHVVLFLWLTYDTVTGWLLDSHVCALLAPMWPAHVAVTTIRLTDQSLMTVQ